MNDISTANSVFIDPETAAQVQAAVERRARTLHMEPGSQFTPAYQSDLFNLRMSVSTSAFFRAMLEAQRGFSNPKKNKKADRYYYADLASLLDGVLESLNEAGIVMMQIPVTANDGAASDAYLVTHLHHGESGEWMECRMRLSSANVQGGNSLQSFGSGITYCRRYTLLALLGLAPEDDDGAAAGATTRKEERKQGRSRLPDDMPHVPYVAEVPLGRLVIQLRDAGDAADACAALRYWGDHIPEMTRLRGETKGTDYLTEALKLLTRHIGKTLTMTLTMAARATTAEHAASVKDRVDLARPMLEKMAASGDADDALLSSAISKVLNGYLSSLCKALKISFDAPTRAAETVDEPPEPIPLPDEPPDATAEFFHSVHDAAGDAMGEPISAPQTFLARFLDAWSAATPEERTALTEHNADALAEVCADATLREQYLDAIAPEVSDEALTMADWPRSDAGGPMVAAVLGAVREALARLTRQTIARWYELNLPQIETLPRDTKRRVLMMVSERRGELGLGPIGGA